MPQSLWATRGLNTTIYPETLRHNKKLSKHWATKVYLAVSGYQYTVKKPAACHSSIWRLLETLTRQTP